MKKEKYVIYQFRNITNGKFYIGRTCDLKRREKEHWRMLRRGAHFNNEMQLDYNKGDSFKCFLIYNNLDKDIAIYLEQHFLDNYCLTEFMYNISESSVTFARSGVNHAFFGKRWVDCVSEDGYISAMESRRKLTGERNGFYGKEHTELTKSILREKCSLKGEQNGFFGKSHSMETKKKLSVGKKGKISKKKGSGW